MDCLEQHQRACTQFRYGVCRDNYSSDTSASLVQHLPSHRLARTLPWTRLSHALDPALLRVPLLEPVSIYPESCSKMIFLLTQWNRSNGRGLIAGACIGILAAAVIVFAIVHFLIKLREWITETKLGLYGNLSTRNGRLMKSQTRDTHVELNNVRTKESAV
jgi:hypothetical protein